MVQRDMVSVEIPEKLLTDIQGAITTLKEKLAPYLKTLTAQERIELPKMGDKTAAFVQKALEYGRQNQELVPSFLDLQALVFYNNVKNAARVKAPKAATIYEDLASRFPGSSHLKGSKSGLRDPSPLSGRVDQPIDLGEAGEFVAIAADGA